MPLAGNNGKPGVQSVFPVPGVPDADQGWKNACGHTTSKTSGLGLHRLAQAETNTPMTDSIALARQSILAPVGLGDSDLDRLISALSSPAIDAADVYFQSSRLQSWMLEDGIIKDGSFNIEQGAGLRAISGEKTGFAYSDELELGALTKAADAARAIARGGGAAPVNIGGAPARRRLYDPMNPIESLDDAAKIDLLHREIGRAHV